MTDAPRNRLAGIRARLLWLLLPMMGMAGCAVQQPVHVTGWDGAPVAMKATATAARWVNQANQQALAADYEHARQYFDTAAREDPLSELPWFQRGVMELKLDNYQSAIDAFEEVLRRNPNQQDALRYRGQAINQQADALNRLKEQANRSAPKPVAPAAKPVAPSKAAPATPFEGLITNNAAPAGLVPLKPNPAPVPPKPFVAKPATDSNNPFGAL